MNETFGVYDEASLDVYLRQYNADIPEDSFNLTYASDDAYKQEMQVWYFSVIGVPITASFVISLTVYLVFSKCMVREYVDKERSGKIRSKLICKHKQVKKQKENKAIHQIVPSH